MRQAQRFQAGWEVKVWGMSQAMLYRLIERDRDRQPKSLTPVIRRDWSNSESYSAIAVEAA